MKKITFKGELYENGAVTLFGETEDGEMFVSKDEPEEDPHPFK
jgi:hypothetical protein